MNACSRFAIAAAVASLGTTAHAAGCSRTGVGGAWSGTGTIDVDFPPAHLGFTFSDEFDASDASLTGDMHFHSLGDWRIPEAISSFLAEQYTVGFGDDTLVDFSSNWGRGDGYWGTSTYELHVIDQSATFSVDERGTIGDCGHLSVSGDFYQMGVHIGRMTANYTRPSAEGAP